MKTQVPPSKRRLAAIMFTDIVGYTAIMQQDEKQAARLRARHRAVFDQYHQQYNGEIIQYFGDGTLSVFQSCVEAVRCAIFIQKMLQQKEVVPLRIGLHMGDIVFSGADVYGDGVNLASRIEALGIPGAILISKKLNDELRNHPDIRSQSLGHFDLKNVASPVEIFAIQEEGLTFPKSIVRKGKMNKTARTLAVLPLVNLSGQPDQEYFSDGMTEEIINALSKIKGLQVTSRTSSFFFKGKNIPVPQIGQELNVNTILEGSIRLSGKRMRLTAQLIDVQEDVQFWSQNFDRSIDDIFAVQDEISLLIAEKLREWIGHFDIEDQLVEAPAIPANVYQQYLKGRYHVLKNSRHHIEKALEIFNAIVKDYPDFALAHLGINHVYTVLGVIGLMSVEESYSKGQPHLEKAITLNENLPDCQIQLSWKSFLQQWDWKTCYVHLAKAAAIRPTVDYYGTMTSVLTAEGRVEPAHYYIDIAIQIDPFSAVNQHLKGFCYYIEEKYELAIQHFRRAQELKNNYYGSVLYWGNTLLMLNRPNEALELYQQLPFGEPDEFVKPAGISMAYIKMKNYAKAAEGMRQLEAALETDAMGRAIGLLIYCYTLWSDFDKALQCLEKGIDARLPMMVYVSVDPVLKKLKSLPKFKQLISRVMPSESGFQEVKTKPKNQLFSAEELEHYQKKLTQLMQIEQPFLDSGLSLRRLAARLVLPPNHLSQLLNVGFHQNFAEYVNHYRLETFKSKLLDPANQHLTLLALAFDSGFNSKTVFNTYFKKKMGMTPRAYLKIMKNK